MSTESHTTANPQSSMVPQHDHRDILFSCSAYTPPPSPVSTVSPISSLQGRPLLPYPSLFHPFSPLPPEFPLTSCESKSFPVSIPTLPPSTLARCNVKMAIQSSCHFFGGGKLIG